MIFNVASPYKLLKYNGSLNISSTIQWRIHDHFYFTFNISQIIWQTVLMIHNISCKSIFRTSKQYTPIKDFILVKVIADRKRLALLASLILNIWVSPLDFIRFQIIHSFSEGKVKLASDTLLHLGLFSVKLVDGPSSSFRSSIWVISIFFSNRSLDLTQRG